MKTSSLVGRSLGTLTAKVLGAGAALGYNLVLARALGPEQYGVFGLAFAFFRASATFARVGLDFVVLRRVAVAHGTRDESSITSIFAHSGALVVSWALAFSRILALASPFIEGIMGVDALGGAVLRMSVGIPLWALAFVWGEGLKGLGAPVQAALVEFATINVVALAAFAAVSGGGSPGPVGLQCWGPRQGRS